MSEAIYCKTCNRAYFFGIKDNTHKYHRRIEINGKESQRNKLLKEIRKQQLESKTK